MTNQLSARRGRLVLTAALAGLLLAGLPAASSAQDGAALKAAYLADIEVMRGKFLGLAEAFPAETYSWRPMEGVRSVSEVLMLIAGEGFAFAPVALGLEGSMSFQEMQALEQDVTDKVDVIDYLTRGIASAQEQLEGVDPATLTGTQMVFGQERTTADMVLLVAGDMHEHLGQLIAYARMNQIVPPWSR